MFNPQSILADARDRVLREFKHAPLGTTGAVLAIGGAVWGLFSIETGRQPIGAPNIPPAFDHLTHAQPSVFPVLQFVILQIVIVFVLDKLNAWISAAAMSVRIAVGVPSTILAAFLTDWNAYYATIPEIYEGRHYFIFEGFWEGAFALTVIVLFALRLERDETHETVERWLSSAATVFPMAVLFFVFCIFFDAGFMDTLEPIWKAVTQQPSQ